MKRLSILFAACMLVLAASAQSDSEVLLTINGEPSTVDEFMYIYQKNNSETEIDKKSLDEYLDLFINFKLKVAAAVDAGIDTTESFKRELAGYRRQATPKYMTDPQAEERIIELAYSRMLNDRQVSHIVVRCPEDASTEEENAAREKIERARLRVTTGLPVIVKKGKKVTTVDGTPEDFYAVALEMSEDPSVQLNKGKIGWVRPFRYVFPLEEAAYNTPVGQISEVFRSPFGFHILKVEAELPHREVHAAHIMKMTPRDNDSIAVIAKQQIDSLYEIAQSGADFKQLAINNSDDRGSSIRGGDLGFFSRGQMVSEFEDAAFALTQAGQITQPIQSQYGWHIIEFIEDKYTPQLSEVREEIRRNLSRSEYQTLVDNAFIEKLKREYNYTEQPNALVSIYEMLENDSLTSPAFIEQVRELNLELATIDNEPITTQAFADYLQTNSKTNLKKAEDIINSKFRNFTEKLLREKEDSNLENKYADFNNLIKEYHDGILLFEISLQNVWDKASNDTTGLREFFEANQQSYKWTEPRYKGMVIYCKDKTTLKAAKQIVKTAHPDSIASYLNNRLNLDSVSYVRYERGLWKAGDNKAVDKYALKVKKAQFTPDEEYPYVFVTGKKMSNPAEYTDERGKVISDYQDYLEKQWVKELRDKYEVVVNQEVFDKLRK